MYVRDTNVISEFREVPLCRADQNVTRWAQSVEVDRFYLSAISIFE